MWLRPRNSAQGKFCWQRRRRKGSPALKASFEELPLPFKQKANRIKMYLSDTAQVIPLWPPLSNWTFQWDLGELLEAESRKGKKQISS